MTDVVVAILSTTEVNSSSVLMSLDIIAILDTLGHGLILERAGEELFGLARLVFSWLRSYLSDHVVRI